MICNLCGNRKEFTMLKETEAWNDKEKKYEPITDGDEYYVCDTCMTNSQAGGHIDTEGDY